MSSRLIILSKGVQHTPNLPALLSEYELLHGRPRTVRRNDRVLAWGGRPSAYQAISYAAEQGLGVVHVEDGFLRSVGLGKDDPPLSIVADDIGLYLNAGAPSRLETLIASRIDDAKRLRAQRIVANWRKARVSKYNHARSCPLNLPEKYVLVVDQTHGDASVEKGGAAARSFSLMLEGALREYPNHRVLLKTHPEVVAGHKKGYFDTDRVRAAFPRVQVIGHDLHPVDLLENAAAVYTVTSQLGFEALLWGKPVRVFGMPFYAGWGLTHDELASPTRRSLVSLEQLVYAVLIEYPRYVDPETGYRSEIEAILDWLQLQRNMRERFPLTVRAIGISRWKRPFIRAFFNGSNVTFSRRLNKGSAGSIVATWGVKPEIERALQCDEGTQVVRIEDAFIRSVGLGASLVSPLSLVQDNVGIYYDGSRVSRLEQILGAASFPDDLLRRAAALRSTICEAGISKYNLDSTETWRRPAGEKKVLLVAGQVEADASLLYGSTKFCRNVELLKAVRDSYPDAHIVYRPHPDVVAGLRASGQGEHETARWCNEVVGPSVSITQLLGDVDEVHVLTSLTGFEALVRGLPVVTYGQPFYAGWGLTTDICLDEAVQVRRTRKLLLDELVAAVLILYPTYVSRVTHKFTTPERALQELIDWRAVPATAQRKKKIWKIVESRR